MKRGGLCAAIAAGCVLVFVCGAAADSIPVANASFESPPVGYADPNIAKWRDAAKPWWYDESGGFLWDQLTGVFVNPGPGQEGHIDNCDGLQAAWMFALPEVEIFQDLTEVYDVGKSYCLTAGIYGGGGGMKDTVPIEFRLYYRDASDVKITIAATEYAYDASGGYIKHFNDVRVMLPPVQAGDAWAGKAIGIQIVSTLVFPDDVDPETGRQGGYWDMDNVRLTSAVPDFTGDCFVNLADFEVMAGEWMLCQNATTDQTGEGCVDIEDISRMAQLWLQTVCEITVP